MIVGCTNSFGKECFRDRLTELSIAAVDDGSSFYSGEYEAHHRRLVIATTYRIGDVGAKKALLIEGIAWAEVKDMLDILDDLACCCRCKSQDGYLGKLLTELR